MLFSTVTLHHNDPRAGNIYLDDETDDGRECSQCKNYRSDSHFEMVFSLCF